MGEVARPFSNDRKPLQELVPLRTPMRLEIDPSSICNFKCDFCFQHRVKNFHGTLLTRELFEKILSQVLEFEDPIKVLYLYTLGEPMVNQDLPYFIRRVHETGAANKIAITSNGSLLTHELTDAMLDSGLNSLSISLNGLSDEDFQRVCNAKVDCEKLYDEISYFYSKKGDCNLHIKIEGDYFSEEEQKYFLDRFSGICDSLFVDKLADIWPDVKIDADANIYGLDNADDALCPQPFYELCVHSDGNVTPCCAIWEVDDYNLGNVNDTTLKEIWGGQKLRDLQMQLLRKEPADFDVCNRCNFPSCGASFSITEFRDEILKKFEEHPL